MNDAVLTIMPEKKGFTICRQGEALRTPEKFPVTVPTEALASTIAEEFVAQGEKPDLRKMPFMQMALTAIDITTQRRTEVIDSIVRYGDCELLCQRATAPDDLVAEQMKVWQPYLDWCKATFEADLLTGSGIVPFEQNPQALERLRQHIEGLDVFVLTGLSEACHILGSLVLGVALMQGRADASAAFDAAELELLWQNKKWGDDPATQSRHAEIRRDLEVCARWFAMLKA